MKSLKINFIIATIFLVLNLVLIPLGIYANHQSLNLYLAIVGSILIPFILPCAQIVFKKDWPMLFQIIICLHTFMGLSFSTTFNMYMYYKNWDMILHGLFGVEALAFGYYIILQYDMIKLPIYIKILLLLTFVLGLAAFWEIIEFTFSNITGNDVQHVFDEREKNGVYDTMWDIIIALITSSITIVLFLIDKLFNKKLMNLIYKSLNYEEKSDLK